MPLCHCQHRKHRRNHTFPDEHRRGMEYAIYPHMRGNIPKNCHKTLTTSPGGRSAHAVSYCLAERVGHCYCVSRIRNIFRCNVLPMFAHGLPLPVLLQWLYCWIPLGAAGHTVRTASVSLGSRMPRNAICNTHQWLLHTNGRWSIWLRIWPLA